MYPNLVDQLNPQHPLLMLAANIPWQYFEDEFAPLYSHRGKAAQEEMCIDTTVQEKNVTYLTDAKQYQKIRVKVLKIAKQDRAIALKRA